MDASLLAAVLFDFGGTLDADGIPWKERVRRLWLEEGLPAADGRFDGAFYAADDALGATVHPTTPLGEVVARLVSGVADALGVRPDAATERVARRFVDDAQARLAGNASLLARLASRYRLGIVSNFYGNLARVCADAGIRPLFAVVVDSADVGCLKPDPRIFRHALDALGLGPADAVFVGDSLPRDMAGARAVGMRHVWLVGDTPAAANPCCPGDRTIRSLGDLEGLLPCGRGRSRAGSSRRARGAGSARRASRCPSRWCAWRACR